MDDFDAISRLETSLARQRAGFLRDGPPPLATRREHLTTLRAAICARRREIEQAIDADFGHRSRHETAAMEVLPLLSTIDFLLKNLPRLMRPQRRRVALNLRFGRARVLYQPLGVVGVVAPWNYPLSLALTPLATALAAGNRVMIKPSEFTPRASALLAEMLSEIFPPEQVFVAMGDAELGAAFCALPFDHLLFTGSTAVGRAVMRAASAHLTPVTLELGGKSPAIVGPEFSLERAAAQIAYGKLANAGQTCIAPDYALVPRAKIDDFCACFDRAVRALYPHGAVAPDYSAIINQRHFLRLAALLDDARAKGARVVELGCDAAGADRERMLRPKILRDLRDDMAIMNEEIFGPLLPVLPYDRLDDAMAFVNARPRPLALYVFSDSAEDRDSILQRTTSGNVTINGVLLHYAQDDLPFGGVGPSGMGAYHGVEGFRALSHAKGVFEQGRWNAATLLRAPFGRLADVVLAALIR